MYRRTQARVILTVVRRVIDTKVDVGGPTRRHKLCARPIAGATRSRLVAAGHITELDAPRPCTRRRKAVVTGGIRRRAATGVPARPVKAHRDASQPNVAPPPLPR